MIYEEWSYMTDFHSIIFLAIDNQNLGIDTKIGFLSGIVRFQNYWIFNISAIMLIYVN